MPLRLNFEWEEATVSTTLSDASPLRSASEFRYPPSQMQSRQAAFYRNLIRLAEDQAARLAAAEPPVDKAAASGDMAQVDAVINPVLGDYAEEAAQSVSFLRAYGLTACSAAG